MSLSDPSILPAEISVDSPALLNGSSPASSPSLIPLPTPTPTPTSHPDLDPDPDSALNPSPNSHPDSLTQPTLIPHNSDSDPDPDTDSDPALNGVLDIDVDVDIDATIPSDPSPSSAPDPAYSPERSEELRRVKVYELIENKWVDKGTAFCQSAFEDSTQMAKLIARSEDNPQDVILQFYIRGEEVYQRQQDTLIVWTEPDGTDYALSFQDNEGCADVWEYILDVQRAINGERDRGITLPVNKASSDVLGTDENDDPLSSSPTGSRPITFSTIVHASQLPPPQFGIMLEVERAINHVGRNPGIRDRLCEHIITTDYVRLMIDLASQAEDLEQLEDLHALCSCMQTILLLNDHSIFEHVTTDDIFLGVCGILEYDPDFPNHKACYREILSKQSHFKQPIPFEDSTIKRKIHQTYRLQFLKDVVLTRVLEDSTFTVLNSCIIFNQIDLINHFTSDENFLRQVVNLFINPMQFCHKKGKIWDGEPIPSTAHSDSDDNDDSLTLDERRRDVIYLIQQLCVMGKNVQLQARLLLFRALVDRGFIHAVQWGLSTCNDVLMSASAEILGVLLDHDINGIRGHIMRQVEVEPNQSLVSVLSTALASGKGDQALRHQLSDCLKSLLETQLPEGAEGALTGIKAMIRQREDPIIEKFLEFVYSKGLVKNLFKALNDMPEYKSLGETPLILSAEKATLYLHLLEILCCSIQQHSFRSSHFLLDSVLAPRIASLLTSGEKHLRLVALRVFRACLKLNNRNITNHLMKHGIFAPIIDLTLRESRRDNLMSSACQEFFEYIRRENPKELINHLMKERSETIHQLAKGSIVGARFQNLIRRWEQNNEPPPTMENRREESSANQVSRSRGFDLEEDEWFNGSDEEDTSSPKVPWMQQHQRLSQPSLLKRKRAPTVVEYPIRRKQYPPSPTPTNSPPSTGLVDYEDDSPTPSSDDDLEEAKPTSISKTSNPAQNSKFESSSREKAPAPIKLPVLGNVAEVRPGAGSSAMHDKGSSGLELAPTRMEKRPREDDEDDELLARLAAKGKRASVSEGREEQAAKTTGIKITLGKVSEGAKKIKLNLGLGRRMENEIRPSNKDEGG